MRPCINEVEELHATQQHHGRWMGNTQAKENCAFAEVLSEGKLGPRGIKLKSERKITMKDIPNLIHNGQKLSRKVKRAFIAAHNKYLHRLFRYPPKDRREFFYPFYLLDSEGTMHREKEVEGKLWKSLASIPSKARHAGFQMATIGRFGKRWRQVLWKIIKLMLVMRYIPNEMKKIARYPIPKPGKLNEYRPISLCNDIYCFLNSIITKITSAAIEKTKILHRGIASYRQGKSCATLVAVEQSFREDCIESNVPSVQLDEDEEKFFDRVCLEIILTAMRINGFPDEGFIEFKACMMGEKLVEIVTCKGTAFAKFVCGLEQGNPDSPTIANLVIKMKHDAWDTVSERIRDIIKNDPNSHCYDRYRFHVHDRDDGEIWIHMMGYCDDNTKFISSHDENLLIPLVQNYIQLAGDLSMITKIGRKSSKCEIHFFNISAKMAMNLEKSWSTAWSFVHDAPIEEQVPFKIFLQDKELTEFYKLIDYDNISADEKIKWNNLVHPKAHRHLGLTSTLGADATASSQATINKMHDRLSKLKLRNMEHRAQVKCSNMLVTSMHSYVPLQNDFEQDELYRIDLSIAHSIMKRNGISHSDCKHRIFLPEHVGGLGFLSTLEVDIVSTARELEILSNCQGIDSESFRTRIAAMTGYSNPNDESIRNHARAAIHKLARYGIFFRDNRDGVINDIIDDIARQNGVQTIGNELFKDGNGFSIGYGKPKYLKFAYGSKLHLALQRIQQNNWKLEDCTMDTKLIAPYKTTDIINLHKSLGLKRFKEVTAFHSYFEWHNFNQKQLQNNLDDESNHWKRVDVGHILMKKYTSIQPWEWDDRNLLLAEITNICRIHWKTQIVTQLNPIHSVKFNTHSIYGKVLHYLDTRGSPIIIATDGAHAQKKHASKTASSFVICSLDIRNNETIHSAEWVNRPTIPLLARACRMPNQIGSVQTDIAHGEGMAFLMQEMCLEGCLPRIVISDSKAIREQLLNIRDNTDHEIDRNFVRKVAGGISKYLVGIVREHMRIKINNKSLNSENRHQGATILEGKFQNRNESFLKVAKSWILANVNSNEEECENKNWDAKYYDDHHLRPILKVDSHQLEKFGRTIKRSPRYNSLIPNLALLNANHHADVGAEIGNRLPSFFETQLSTDKLTIFSKPSANLTFSFVCNGNIVDRHISGDIKRRLQMERIKRLRSKATQGVLWRIMPYVTITWKILNLHKGLFRSLLGMSNSHSRCIYKSATYRAGALQQFLSTVHDSEKRKCIEESPTQEQNKYILQCGWCSTSEANIHKGNRRHILLHCSNHKIVKFRRRMLNTLGLHLSNFFKEMEERTSTLAMTSFIKKIEEEFLKLQREQVGRLKQLSKTRNILYIDVNSYLIKIQADSISMAIKFHAIDFFLNLFHLQPERLINEPTDEELGILDTIWLGLMPITISKLVQKHLQNCSRKVHGEDGSSWLLKMEHSWKAIEALNMGRAIGIHRIMSGIGSEKEKEFIATYDIQEVVNATKKRKQARAIPGKGGSTEVKNDAKRRKKTVSGPKLVETRCNGITCGLEKVRWCPHNNFHPNMITINRKQCLRCSLFTTAMKTTLSMLIELENNSESIQLKFLKKLRQSGNKRKIDYSSLMTMLKEYIPSHKQFERAQYISKYRPTEKWKKICRLLLELSKNDTETTTTGASNTNPLSTWIADMEQTLNIKNTELKTDALFLRNCMKEFQSVPAHPPFHSTKGPSTTLANTQHSTILPNQTKTPAPTSPIRKADTVLRSESTEKNIIAIHCSPDIESSDNIKGTTSTTVPTQSSQEDIEGILRAKISLMNRRLYTAGSIILMAIEVIRSKYKNENIFIACTEAAQIIEQWNPNEGWARFARIFYSNDVCNRKPNGLYLLPIFSGNNDSGHWKVAAIEKKRGQRRATLLDSLGTGNLADPVIQLISQAFSPNRGTISWTTPPSQQQTGVECGARTICTLATLAKAFHDGKTLDEGTQEASLLNEAEYDQMEIRRSAANLVGEYRSHMVSRAIRIRRGR